MHPKLSRLSRRRLCACLVGALLMVQWLVAAHACPAMHGPVSMPPAAMAGVHGAPCHEQLTAGDEAVCKAQCADEQRAPSPSLTPDAPATGWCMVMALPPLSTQADVRPLFAAAHAAAPPGWPPIYIRLGALRN